MKFKTKIAVSRTNISQEGCFSTSKDDFADLDLRGNFDFSLQNTVMFAPSQTIQISYVDKFLSCELKGPLIRISTQNREIILPRDVAEFFFRTVAVVTADFTGQQMSICWLDPYSI